MSEKRKHMGSLDVPDSKHVAYKAEGMQPLAA
jgi:hypothetical protein